jgi:hypothetical protein
MLSDADAFHFELCFRLPDSQRVSGSGAEVRLTTALGRDRLVLKTAAGEALSDTGRLDLAGYGYETEGQAREVAERAHRALILSAVEENLSLEWRRPNEDTGKALASVWKGHRHRVVLESGGRASGVRLVDPGVLGAKLARWMESDPQLTSGQSACAELLRSAGFDPSPRSRLILAMSAIEQLVPARACRGADYQEAVDVLLDALAAIKVESNVRQSLEQDLKGSRFTKTRGKCLDLITDRLGQPNARDFDRLYSIRGRAAHADLSRGEISAAASEALALARRLFLADVEAGLAARRPPAAD